MNKPIPAPLIAVISEIVSETETHASLDSLFMYAGAPGDPPDGSKHVKALEWLRITNKDSSLEPLEVLGQIIEGYMEYIPDSFNPETQADNKKRIEEALTKTKLRYVQGGIVCTSAASPSLSLKDIIRKYDISSINSEFDRALRNVESNPPEAVSAASNILESICKVYIEDEGLEMPKKKDLQPVWSVVRKDLGFDPKSIEDRDLKEILSGIFATVNGIGALRTHASTAHASGRNKYNLEPRHARLAIHSAHTIASFIMESWEKKNNKNG
jgi:Abortive infection C-terminus